MKRIPLALIARRVAAIPLLLFLVASASFLIMNSLPGDPAAELAGPTAEEKDIAEVRAKLGLDRPIAERYTDFVGGVVQGDLGESYISGKPVRGELQSRLAASLELVLSGVVLALVWGVSIGAISAYWRGRAIEKGSRVLIGLQQATPDFVAGLLLVFLLAFKLGWLPQATGRLDLLSPAPTKYTGFYTIDSLIARDWSKFREAAGHLILPAVSMAFHIAATYALVVRTTLGRSLRTEQVEFARACGLPEWRVVWYASTVIRGPLLTYVAMTIGTVTGGAAVIERVFNWHGVASWGVESIMRLDIPSVQGFVVVMGMLTILIYLVLDIVVALVDPRVRLK